MRGTQGYGRLGGIGAAEAADLHARSGAAGAFAAAWRLADRDADGRLAAPEFCLFMYLLKAVRRGLALPGAPLTPAQLARILGPPLPPAAGSPPPRPAERAAGGAPGAPGGLAQAPGAGSAEEGAGGGGAPGWEPGWERAGGGGGGAAAPALGELLDRGWALQDALVRPRSRSAAPCLGPSARCGSAGLCREACGAPRGVGGAVLGACPMSWLRVQANMPQRRQAASRAWFLRSCRSRSRFEPALLPSRRQAAPSLGVCHCPCPSSFGASAQARHAGRQAALAAAGGGAGARPPGQAPPSPSTAASTPSSSASPPLRRHDSVPGLAPAAGPGGGAPGPQRGAPVPRSESVPQLALLPARRAEPGGARPPARSVPPRPRCPLVGCQVSCRLCLTPQRLRRCGLAQLAAWRPCMM